MDTNKKDITKQNMYEAVKMLVEMENDPRIHLNQHKLFSLFSVAFQYFLFRSTKEPGAYIIRIEDSLLADKLTKKAKDESTRKFMQALSLPRKLKYNKSLFYLDFFHIGSWNLTNELPKDKVKGALIVKNTSSRPMSDLGIDDPDEDQEQKIITPELPADYYLSSLSFVPKIITIALEQTFEDHKVVAFPFIKKDPDRNLSGVKISKDLENLLD